MAERDRYSDKRNSQFQLRFGEDLHDRLKISAAANSRSINTEIIHRLTASFEPAQELAPAINAFIQRAVEDEVKARLKAIASQIGGA